jgi:hypothetical protein
MDAFVQGLGAGGLDRRQAVVENRGEDFHHLPIAAGGACKLAPDFLHGGGENPVLEWRAVSQGTGLSRQNRHVMPGVVGRLFPTEAAVVFADDDLILANDDAAA